MGVPDLRSLTLPQIVLTAVVLAVGIAVIGMALGRRRGSGGTGIAVWIVVPFLIAACGFGAWLLIQVVKTTGLDF